MTTHAPLPYPPTSLPRAGLYPAIEKLGLLPNLKVCLDAGDAGSLPASSTKWLDLSGNGYDFFRGSSASSASDDPTINGTAGAGSSAEYLSFDGGDWLVYDTANESWMQNLHRDNAKFTIATYVFLPASITAQCAIVGDYYQGTDTGGRMFIYTDKTLHWAVSNGSANAIDILTSNLTLSSQWNFLAVSLDEAVGANGAILQVNGKQELFTSTYASPSASSATRSLSIGGVQTATTTPLLNGSRMASMGVWEGVALSAGQLNALFQATRSKFGM